MRNPLSAIVHSADTISATLNGLPPNMDMSKIPGPVVDALRENVSAAKVILDCAKHQKRIIDDILTLGRLEATLLSVKPSAVKPSKLVDTILSLFEAELRSNKITTNVTAERSMQELSIDYLYLDPSRVTQIFLNLLTNAIKFVKRESTRNIEIRYGATLTPPRSTEGTDLLSNNLHWATKGKNAADVTKDSEWGTGEIIYLIFSLSDTDIGMHETEIVKIFERFQQASIKTHMTCGGSGLGLYISKELTEKMAGEIAVSSQPGAGSQFAFYIKTRRVEPKSGCLPLRTVTAAPLGTKPPHKLCVLLVEDNIINQQLLQRHLTKSHCHVLVANNGVEALGLLQKPEAHFDIVLMDVQMPVMDGLTCTAEIRRLEGMATLKGRLLIIVVTANVRQEQIEIAMAAGAVG